MRESVACTEIKNSFWEHGFWAYKIPDPRGFGPEISGHRKRPFDMVAFIRDYGLAIEVKMLKKWQKFSPRKIEDHQKKALSHVVDRGGLAYIFLNIRIQEEAENRLLIFDWSKWRDVLCKTGLSADRLRELSYCQGRKGTFNLEKFLKEFEEDGNIDGGTIIAETPF